MYCGKCGSLIKEGNAFCTCCGAPVNTGDEASLPAPAEPAAPTENKDTDINNLLIWCILALVIAFLPLINWVFTIIARNKVKAYRAAGGTPSGQFRLAVNLTKFALVFTIITTVVAFIACIVLAVCIAVRSLVGPLLRAVLDAIIGLFKGGILLPLP